MYKHGILALAVLAAINGGAASAQTAGDFGSAVYQTKRNCGVGVAVCDGTGQTVLQRGSAGGAGIAVSNTLVATGTGLGSSAYGAATFGGFGLPEMKARVTTVGNVRMGNYLAAYQSYTYTGVEDFNLLLNANFHIDNSSTDGADGNHAGGAIAVGGFAVWDAADFFSYSEPYFTGDGTFNSAISLYGQPQLFGSYSCGDFEAFADPVDLPHAPRATSSGGGGLAGGEATVGIGQQNCHEATLTIRHGDQFVIAAFTQLIANRDGFVDATGTFTLGLDPAMGAANIDAFQSGIRLGLGAVPEPASWAMMMIGFCAVGIVSRRRGTQRAVIA